MASKKKKTSSNKGRPKNNLPKGKAPSQAQRTEEIMKCGTDPVYFINTYMKVPHPTKGLIPFDTYPFQDDCLRAYQDNRWVIVNKSRQLGLSTISAAYSLWMALFQREKNILVIATKMETAKIFIKKVRAMYDSLPGWLIMPELRGQSVKKIEWSNGSQVQAIPTGPGAARGESISVLIVDECTSGDSYITLRNKNTGEVKSVTIEEFYQSLQV